MALVFPPGYWPSYNIPFYESIYKTAGWPRDNRPDDSYQLSPRAKIFRRDANAVQNFTAMMDIMRYNGEQEFSFRLCGRDVKRLALCQSFSYHYAAVDLDSLCGSSPFDAD